MKIVKFVLIFIIIAAAGLFAGFQYFFRSAVPEYSGTETLPGLTAPVEVRTDAFGIPHIYAENETDLFYAQGYIMARERLFQMDLTRRAGRGELSTLFGEVTLKKDRFLKTMGFYRKARSSVSALLPETRKILEVFSAGINHYIETADALPREYFLLGGRPEKWVPEDSVVVVLMMSYSLTRSKKIDLVMHRIREKAGDAIMKQMIPAYPEFAPVLVDGGDNADGADAVDPPPLTAATAMKRAAIGDRFPVPFDIAASNWMAFSGRMTDTGQPMFAGSPDLSPTLPGLFYIMHLKGGGIDAMGGVLPGVPSFGPLGFNGFFAFSAVNGRGDEMDYFLEKVHPDNPNQYLTPKGYRDFKIIEDNIRIKTDDGFRTEALKIRLTRHGPIITDVMPGAPENCAVQWSALALPNRDIDGLIKMLKAKSFEAFRKAASYIRTVNLNLGYADKEGNIGWQFIAAPPIRKKGKGSYPVPGWTGEYDWNGFVPFEELPYDLNPFRGYVASFNNEPGNARHFLTNYYLFERALSFERIMKTRPERTVSFDELKQMQLDTHSMVAMRWVPPTLAVCEEDSTLAACRALFADWDYRIDRESSAATLFNYYYFLLMENTLQDELGEEIWKKDLGKYLYYVPDRVMIRIMDDPGHPLYDDVSTADRKERRDDIIRKSIRQALAYLNERLGEDPKNWKWGDLHTMTFEHPLGGKLPFLNLDPIPTDGSPHTINAGFWDTTDPFKFNSGGVIRMMIDFADPQRSTIISPPGQSGHYLSPYYDDVARIWAQGDQLPMRFHAGRDLPGKLMLLPEK